ncbi:MAG: MCP four helix bundle domain-containing protein, partial [Deefgea sp.]
MKIAHKLMLQVALAGLAIVLLTAVSYFKLQDVKTHAADVSDNVLPSVLLLSDAQLQFAGARIQALNQMMQNDETQKKVYTEEFNKSIDKTLDALKKYEPYIIDDLDRKNIDTFKSELNIYATATREVMALSTAQEQDAALSLSRNKAAPQAEKVFVAAAEAVKLNQQYVEQSRKNISSAITSA